MLPKDIGRSCFTGGGGGFILTEFEIDVKVGDFLVNW